MRWDFLSNPRWEKIDCCGLLYDANTDDSFIMVGSINDAITILTTIIKESSVLAS